MCNVFIVFPTVTTDSLKRPIELNYFVPGKIKYWSGKGQGKVREKIFFKVREFHQKSENFVIYWKSHEKVMEFCRAGLVAHDT